MAGALAKIARPLCLALLAGGVVVGGALAGSPNEQLNPADQKLAQRLILHFQDMPSGWAVELNSKSKNACRHLLAGQKVIVTGKAESEFSYGQTAIAGSLAAVTRDTKGTETAYKYLSTATPKCLLDAMKRAGSDASIGTLSFPHFGDKSAAWEAQATPTNNGRAATIYFDAVLVRKGRAVGLYFFDGLGAADPYQEIPLVRKVVRRG
jgi:hypothetical protein